MNDDAVVLDQLAPLTDPRWHELFASIELWRNGPTPFTRKHFKPGSTQMPWVQFDETFNVTFSLMFKVGLLLTNLEWKAPIMATTWEEQAKAIEQYSLASCAKYLTYVARKDRFIEGLLASNVEEGFWLMALDRVRSLVAPDWKPSPY